MPEYSNYVEGRTNADALDGSELVAISQDGAARKTTTQDIADLAPSAGIQSVVAGTNVTVDDTDPLNPIVSASGGGGGTWGSITGTLSSQADLQSALDGKETAGAAATAQAAAIAAAAAATIGVQDLFIPASAMWPAITNGCAPLAQSEIATSLFNIQTLNFDQTTEEHAQFQIVLPRKWNNLTFTFVPYWTASAGTPGQTVRWQMNGAAYANDDSLTTAPGSSIAVDDTLLATNDLHIGAESSPVTLSNTPASADFLMFQVHRGVASDDLAADAKLLGVSIRITTTAAKDA